MQYFSSRCKRLTGSVLDSGVHKLIMGMDNAFVVRKMLIHILSKSIHIEALVESKAVFHLIAKHGRTYERQILITVSSLRDSYANGAHAHIGCSPGGMNPANALTNPLITTTSALSTIMIDNSIDRKPIVRASISPAPRPTTALSSCSETL